MVGYLQLAQLARTANARISSARDLEARWNALGPEGQAEARVEWDRVTVALKVVRDRVAAGPRGFVREFKSAYKGEETAPIADPQSLGKMLGELHAATNAFREKLDAVDIAQQQTAAAAGAAEVAGAEAGAAASDPSGTADEAADPGVVGEEPADSDAVAAPTAVVPEGGSADGPAPDPAAPTER